MHQSTLINTNIILLDVKTIFCLPASCIIKEKYIFLIIISLWKNPDYHKQGSGKPDCLAPGTGEVSNFQPVKGQSRVFPQVFFSLLHPRTKPWQNIDMFEVNGFMK
jgi:hypothetical protein